MVLSGRNLCASPGYSRDVDEQVVTSVASPLDGPSVRAGSLSGPPAGVPGQSGPADVYGLVNAALGQLARSPDDVQAALAACTAFLRLGLGQPAREMAERVCLLLRSEEASRLGAQLAGAASGQVDWRLLEGRFTRNARRLCERYPELRPLMRLWRGMPRELELYRSTDGNWHLSRRDPAGRQWIGGLLNARACAASVHLPRSGPGVLAAPLVLLGDRCNVLLERVFALTDRMFLSFSPRLYVLEPDWHLLGLALYACESLEALCHERVALLAGPDCPEQLADLLRREPRRGIPTRVVRTPAAAGATAARLAEVLAPVVQERHGAAQAVMARARQLYAALPADHWRHVYSSAAARRLRVLGLTSRFTTVLQYSMRDVQEAFRHRGHEFTILLEDNDHDLLTPAEMASAVCEQRPDLVFVIDHLRREYDFIPLALPFVCWIQDSLPNLMSREAGRSLTALDFYIAPEIAPLVNEYGYPPGQGLASTALTNHLLYSAEALPAGELRELTCDLCYVSNHSRTPAALHQELAARFGSDPGAARITARLFELLCCEAERGAPLPPRAPDVVLAAATDCGLELEPQAVEPLALYYVLPMRDLLLRQTVLTWAAELCEREGLTLHLYGRGWESHPRLGRYARGIASNGPHLRAIYQAGRIHLQLIAYGAIHPRLLDGLAAGGFFLIRRCATDLAHEPIRRVLAEFDTHRLEPECAYTGRQYPRLAAALRDWAVLSGHAPPAGSAQADPPTGPFVVSRKDLQRFRELAAHDFHTCAGAVFDDYPRVSFATRQEFEQQVRHFLADPQERRAITARMREVVVARYTYVALVDRLVEFLAQRLGRSGG